VSGERRGERGFQPGQLLAQAADDRHRGRHDLPVGGGHHRRCLQLLAGQRRPDRAGADVDLARMRIDHYLERRSAPYTG
jgi:hypothetical protein